MNQHPTRGIGKVQFPRRPSLLRKDGPFTRARTRAFKSAGRTSATVSQNVTYNKDYSKKQTRSTEGWSDLSRTLRNYDEAKIWACKEDIDTLLVFAGLFSAVLTAFIIEIYQFLQEDPANVSARTLQQISQQLDSFVIGAVFINTTHPSRSASPFHPSSTAVTINALWFSSLVFSLITVSLGMLVKQWLREYLAGASISPKQRCRVRYYRHKGLVRYRVFEIAAFLPMLLQIALVLFFIGLSDFVLSLNRVVGWVVTVIIIIFLVAYVTATMTSAFSSDCPYKTPLSPSMKRVSRRVFSFTQQWLCCTPPPHETHSTIRKEDEEAGLDIKVLVDADATFLEAEFLETIRQCLEEFPASDVEPCILQILAKRFNKPSGEMSLSQFLVRRKLGDDTLNTVLLILVDAMPREIDLRVFRQWQSGEIWDSFIERLFTSTLLAVRSEEELLAVQQLSNRLLSLDTIVAGHLLDHLSRTWCDHNYGDVGLPKVINSKVMSHIIDGANILLESDVRFKHPVHLYGLVEAAAQRMRNDELATQKHTEAFSRLTGRLADVMQSGDFSFTFRFKDFAKTHSKNSRELIRKYPGLIDVRLLNAIQYCIDHVDAGSAAPSVMNAQNSRDEEQTSPVPSPVPYHHDGQSALTTPAPLPPTFPPVPTQPNTYYGHPTQPMYYHESPSWQHAPPQTAMPPTPWASIRPATPIPPSSVPPPRTRPKFNNRSGIA